MKSIFFLNNVLIIFLSLSACTEGSFIENKSPLQGMIATRRPDPQGIPNIHPKLNSNNANDYFCYICREYHTCLNSKDVTRCIKVFGSPPFIKDLNYLLSIRGGNLDIFSIITDESLGFGYGLFKIFWDEFANYKDKPEVEQDIIWNNFLKIIYIRKELPKIGSDFIKIFKALEQEEENQKNKEKSYLYYYLISRFRALEKDINSLKGNNEFINLSLKCIKFIDDFSELDRKYELGLIKTKQEESYLLALKNDIKLSEKFFEAVNIKAKQ